MNVSNQFNRREFLKTASAATLGAALAARNRAALGFNAPPDGLTFLTARYDWTRAATESGNITTA